MNSKNDFLDALRLKKSAELGVQVVVLGRVLRRIKPFSEIQFCGGDLYPPITREFTENISKSKSSSTHENIASTMEMSQIVKEDLRNRAKTLLPEIPVSDTSLVRFFNTQLTATIIWFNDFLRHYTDSTTLLMDISVINFEVKKQDIVDQTRLAYFIFLTEIKCLENEIVSSKPNNVTAFEMPKKLYDHIEFQNLDELFIKIETKTDPILLENLIKISHTNIMKVIKMIFVNNVLVATVNEKLYSLKTIFDEENQNNRLSKSEIENIQFVLKLLVTFGLV